jgi:acyl-ACP thioesterase
MYEMITKERFVDSDICNRWSVLRTSSMLMLFQKISGEHSNAMGYTKEFLFDRGLLWVLVRENIEVTRLPHYGDTVTVRTWVGKPRLGLFPRFYDIVSSEGETLVKAASTWAVMNAKTRSFARLEEHGMEFEAHLHGDEIDARVKMPRDAFGDEKGGFDEEDFHVPFSYLDVNGHMNNTRYFDLADDLLPSPADGKELAALSIELAQEIRPGMPVSIKWRRLEEDLWYMEGHTDKPCYKLLLRYR